MPSIPLAGDPLALLFDHHQRWLLDRLRLRLRNRADAEDLAAETFCQIVASRIDPAEIVEPRAYLTTIAQRLVYHFQRRRALEKAWLERLAQAPQESAPSAEEQALLLEAIVRIDQALNGLPQIARKAFLYSLLDDLDYAEIARRLHVSVRTVGRYMKQALRQCWLARAG